MALFPMTLLLFSEIKPSYLLKKLLWIQPFILGIGILNPIFDQTMIALGHLEISRGWLTFLNVFIKYNLSISVSILLLATTGIENLSMALRMIKVPRFFVLQLLITYHYLEIFMDEVSRILMAYKMRTPKGKGIKWDAWGSLLGQLVIRTFERSTRIHHSMILRGFSLEYEPGSPKPLKGSDFLFFITWILFFLLIKLFFYY